MNIKQTVLQDWQNRIERARHTLAELESELAGQQYELEIAQRVLAKAQNETDRETWRIQVDVLLMFPAQTEEQIKEEQEDIALCAAMLAELEADLATG